MNENKKIDELYHFLQERQAEFCIHNHSSNIHTAEEGAKSGFGDLGSMAPTLVLKTEKGFLAAIISGETRLIYKKIKKELGLKDVSLASAELAKEITGAEVGTICLLNPDLETIIDSHLLEIERVFGGCGLPGYTLEINTADLVRVSGARVFEFAEKRGK